GQGYSNARLSYASNSELSEEMYLWITDFMATYLGRQRNEAMRREGTELLKFYHDTWSHYEFSARMMESMFGMLSREWIKPENSYGRNVYTISSLLHQMWFTHLLEPIHTHMMKNMLKLVNDRRNNAVIDDAVLRKMPDIFKQHNPPTIRRGIRYTTGVYGMYYESPYITKSIEFHSRRLRNMFSAGRLCEYVHNVHELVAVEDSLASSYMLECSRESLHHMLNQEFIFRVASLILQAVPELLKAMKEDDLHVVYTLFLRIHHEDGLAPMCKLFEEYVIERLTAGSPARTATENSSRAAAENTHAFVSWLLDQYDDLKSVVHRVFGDNELFVASLGASFKDAVNSNELYSSLDRKAPVLIADYISSFLKVGSASFKQLETSVADPEDEIAVRVRRVMGVLWFVKEKDTFVRFYNLELSKRLVAEQTISFSLELTIGGIIKEAVGAAGTLQLDDMLKDIQISKNLTHEFASNKRSQGVNVDVKVLKAVTWSHHLPESNPKLPPMLDSIRQDFTVVYKKAHAGRDLAWLWQESKAEIRLFLPTAKGAAGRNGYTVIVTTYQLAIFGMFTADSGPGTGYDSAKGPTLTCAEVQKGTDMTKDQTIAELTYLVKSRIF
ncbi:ubiquitin ligase (cullin) of SCF, partial [Linderina macrospora]